MKKSIIIKTLIILTCIFINTDTLSAQSEDSSCFLTERINLIEKINTDTSTRYLSDEYSNFGVTGKMLIKIIGTDTIKVEYFTAGYEKKITGDLRVTFGNHYSIDLNQEGCVVSIVFNPLNTKNKNIYETRKILKKFLSI